MYYIQVDFCEVSPPSPEARRLSETVPKARRLLHPEIKMNGNRYDPSSCRTSEDQRSPRQGQGQGMCRDS